MMKFTLLTLSFWASSASAATEIARGYETDNDVSDIMVMGTDLDAMDDAILLDTPDGLATAQDIYGNGDASNTTFKSLSSSSSPLASFEEYYGSSDYANEYIMAGFANGATSFTNGNSDFSSFGPIGQREIVKKGVQYLTAYMNVIEHLQGAVTLCESKSEDESILSWDKAVALFYGTEGEMVYDMGDKRCVNFGTCGDDGTSYVNSAIFEKFIEGQGDLADKKCDDVATIASTIIEHMAVPLVQGVIRAAYKLDIDDGEEKQAAYGAVFSAAILPFVHACNADDAAVIHMNMAPGANSTDFAAVKTAFENTYECLNIDCAVVGGLVDDDGSYFEGAEPCGVSASKSGGDEDGTASEARSVELPTSSAQQALGKMKDVTASTESSTESSSASISALVRSAAIIVLAAPALLL